jgi:peptidyl-prolyl cis-trans isomerase C
MCTIHDICLFLSLSVISGLGADHALATGLTKAEPGKVVARINGTPIYEAQLTPGVETSLMTFRKYGMRKEDSALVKRLRKRALDTLIGNELLRQESQKLTIEDIDVKVEQELKTLERKYGQGKGLEAYLKTRQLTPGNVRDSLRAKIRIKAYLKQQGISEPEIPEERVRQTYEANPKMYTREESVDVSHILIAANGKAGLGAKAQVREKAEQIRKEILAGQDFAGMARIHSDCRSAPDGGRLIDIKRGYMPKGFDKVAFAMEKGALSTVVETRFGYHLIKMLDKKPAGAIPFEQVKPFIVTYLQEGESKKRRTTHIAGLRCAARIELFLTQ